MPSLPVNGITLNYEQYGAGPLVVLVMGVGAPGSVWRAHQVPDLVDAGFRVVTYDSRGISPIPDQTPRYCPPVDVPDLVDDLAALIEHLGGPAHVVGTSLGARVVQELLVVRPDLVHRAVAMGAHTRIDAVGHLLTRGEQDLFDGSVTVPPAYQAAVEALLNLSPATLRDRDRIGDWLDILEYTATPIASGERGQLGATERLGDRTEAYRAIGIPLLAMGFADDLMIPPYLAREVAAAVPSARYVEVPDTGHYGYLERPDQVNRLVIDFLREEFNQVG